MPPPHDLADLSSPTLTIRSTVSSQEAYSDLYELSSTKSTQSGPSSAWDLCENTDGNASQDHLEDEDPEVTFYRELREKEETKRERLAARRVRRDKRRHAESERIERWDVERA